MATKNWIKNREDVELIEIINDQNSKPKTKSLAKNELKNRNLQLKTIDKDQLLMAHEMKKNKLHNDEIEIALIKGGLSEYESQIVVKKLTIWKKHKIYGIICISISIILLSLFTIMLMPLQKLVEASFYLGIILGGGIMLIFLSFFNFKIHLSFEKVRIFSIK